jgi:hypothetical protein
MLHVIQIFSLKKGRSKRYKTYFNGSIQKVIQCRFKTHVKVRIGFKRAHYYLIHIIVLFEYAFNEVIILVKNIVDQTCANANHL